MAGRCDRSWKGFGDEEARFTTLGKLGCVPVAARTFEVAAGAAATDVAEVDFSQGIS